MDDIFELVGVYPYYRQGTGIYGTVHVFIKGINLDLRGIEFIYTETTGKTLILDPTLISWDYEDKKLVRFPVVKFMDSVTFNCALRQQISHQMRRMKLPQLMGKKEYKKNLEEALKNAKRNKREEKSNRRTKQRQKIC